MNHLPGRMAQSIAHLTEVACLTEESGVQGSIPYLAHTFVETDHEFSWLIA